MSIFTQILEEAARDKITHQEREAAKVQAWADRHPELNIDVEQRSRPDWWKQPSSDYLDGTRQTIWDYPEIDQVRFIETEINGESCVILNPVRDSNKRPTEIECMRSMRRQCLVKPVPITKEIIVKVEHDWTALLREAYQEFKSQPSVVLELS